MRTPAPVGLTALIVGLCGCQFQSGGVGSSGDDDTTAAETTDEGSASGSMTATSQSSATTSSDTTSTSDTTGTDTGPITSTGTGPGTSTSTSTSTSSDTGTGTTASPTQEVLQNHDGSCEGFLWCHDGMGNGFGPTFVQECFTGVALPTPYTLLQLDYEIGAAGPLSDLTLQVRSWTGSGPGALLHTETLTPQDGQIGVHSITLNPSYEVQQSSFCVGLHSSDGYAMRVDLDYGSPNTSFLRFDACDINSFVEVSEPNPMNLGNWCLTATIEG